MASTQTVKVRLRKPSRVFTFVAKDIPLKREDTCVVRTDRGLEFGTCVLPPEEAPEDVRKRFKMTVVRRATHHDQLTHRQIQDDERRALEVCSAKVREREMAMRLVECEYAFDRKKIIFYFTAEDRVDFRELVKDLAREFKTRIELRHIQVRDQAKLVGGIGACGRELCCTTWIREFVPISMKMAKRQNLSLNPTKISGQCGRLMCCLSYENDQYANAKKKAKPKPDGDQDADASKPKTDGDQSKSRGDRPRRGGKAAGASKAANASKPQDLGAIRDEMEANKSEAVDTLRETTLGDVIDEPKGGASGASNKGDDSGKN